MMSHSPNLFEFFETLSVSKFPFDGTHKRVSVQAHRFYQHSAKRKVQELHSITHMENLMAAKLARVFELPKSSKCYLALHED